jgi:hypothetical protein
MNDSGTWMIHEWDCIRSKASALEGVVVYSERAATKEMM